MNIATASSAATNAALIRNMRHAVSKLEKQIAAFELNSDQISRTYFNWAVTESVTQSADHLADALAILEMVNLNHGSHS